MKGFTEKVTFVSYLFPHYYHHIWASQVVLVVQNPLANAGDLGLIPGAGRSPAEGNGHPLQYSCLENSTDRGAWHATVRRVARVRHDLVTKPPSQPYNLQAHSAFS